MNAVRPHKFSIITIVNKDDVYQQFKSELEEQSNADYELIKINNDQGQFDSAREAYNAAAAKANGEYLAFLHPDIRFLDKNALADIFKQIESIKDFGVAGIAGCPVELRNGHYILLTNLKQGAKCQDIGDNISGITEVQTVDECFFVMKKSFWEKVPFSDIKGWHFYAVEECLRAAIQGKKNYVVPARIWHKSDGASENLQYVEIGKEIVRRYGKHFPYINTTVSKWETHGLKKYYTPWTRFVQSIVMLHVRRNPKLHHAGQRVKHIFIKPDK